MHGVVLGVLRNDHMPPRGPPHPPGCPPGCCPCPAGLLRGRSGCIAQTTVHRVWGIGLHTIAQGCRATGLRVLWHRAQGNTATRLQGIGVSGYRATGLQGSLFCMIVGVWPHVFDPALSMWLCGRPLATLCRSPVGCCVGPPDVPIAEYPRRPDQTQEHTHGFVTWNACMPMNL